MVRPASGVSLAAAVVAASVSLSPCLAAAQAPAPGPVPVQTTTTTATETKAFEVIAVSADSLLLRLPEGPKEMAVSDAMTFTVSGEPIAVRDLLPGMKGVATITTTTYATPQTVTEIKDARVVLAGAGTIVLRTTDGETKAFNQAEVDKRGVMLIRDGKPATVADFRTGERVSATILAAAPPRIVQQQALSATLEPPAPVAQTAELTPADAGRDAQSGPADAAVSESLPDPAPESVTASAATNGAVGTSGFSDELPKTASPAPLFALAGVVALTAALLSKRYRAATRRA